MTIAALELSCFHYWGSDLLNLIPGEHLTMEGRPPLLTSRFSSSPFLFPLPANGTREHIHFLAFFLWSYTWLSPSLNGKIRLTMKCESKKIPSYVKWEWTQIWLIDYLNLSIDFSVRHLYLSGMPSVWFQCDMGTEEAKIDYSIRKENMQLLSLRYHRFQIHDATICSTLFLRTSSPFLS